LASRRHTCIILALWPFFNFALLGQPTGYLPREWRIAH